MSSLLARARSSRCVVLMDVYWSPMPCWRLAHKLQVELWIVGHPSKGAGAEAQAMSFPANVGAFMRPSIAKHRRLQALRSQGTWVTDDQMSFGLDTIAASAGKAFQVVDPIVMHRCLHARNPAEFKRLVYRVSPKNELIAAFVCQGHWVTMHWRCGFARVFSWTSAPAGILS